MFVSKDDKCNAYSKAFSIHANSFMGTAETAHYCFDFFFFVLFGNMEILLLVQKWCNASSNTKNSKKYIIIKALHCRCLKFLLLHLSA